MLLSWIIPFQRAITRCHATKLKYAIFRHLGRVRDQNLLKKIQRYSPGLYLPIDTSHDFLQQKMLFLDIWSVVLDVVEVKTKKIPSDVLLDYTFP